MAYTTGTTTSMKALFDAVVAFAVANGWTEHDALTSVDKVLKSVGTDGKQQHYVRIAYETRTMKFHGQSANFTAGATLIGATSFASAKILSVTNSAGIGTMELYDVDGVFLNGETLADDNGTPGAALAGDGSGTLAFDAQASNFVVGDTVTGGTSGATGIVTDQVDAGATGTLTLRNVIGTFVDNETITSGGGSATANGALTKFTGTPAVTFGSRRRDPANVENAMDFLICRGYNFWDAVAHTGTGEFSQVGPWIFTSNGGATQNEPMLTRINNFAATSANPFVIPPARILADDRPDPDTTFTRNMRRPLALGPLWDGNRIMRSQQGDCGGGWNETFIAFDMAANTLARCSTRLHSAQTSQTGVHVWDKANDRASVFSFRAAATDMNAAWYRWDTDGNAWVAKQNPTSPVAALSTGTLGSRCRLAWDGGEYIYATHSLDVKWGRYHIPTNTWASIANAPAIASGSGGSDRNNGVCYVPKSITGAAEDMIFTLLGQLSTTLNVYRVGANVWKTHTPALPASAVDASTLFWDGARWLYFAAHRSAPDSTKAWRLDLTDIVNNPGRAWEEFTLHASDCGANTYCQAVINPVACKVKGKQGATMTYRVLGDIDTITISTTIGVGDSYWCQFGAMAAATKNTSIATTSALSGVGPLVSVAVDSSTGFRVGEKVRAIDPATGTVTPLSVLAKADGTHMSFRLTAALPSGTRIVVDGVHTMLTGDTGWAVFGHDASGFEGDKQTSTYRCVPMLDEHVTTLANPDGDANYTGVGFVVYDNHNASLKSAGLRGSIKHIQCMRNDAYPAPIDGDTFTDPTTTKTYKILTPKHSKRTPDERNVLFGPID
jgi:hypothetical protein